jgi:hypothetical protein
MSNQKQIGVAFQMYAEDNKDYYPAYDNWATWGGPPGSGRSGWHRSGVNTTNRPLNSYVGNSLNVFDCPADRGDSTRLHYAGATCFGDWGNSYLMLPWKDDVAIKHVGGIFDPNDPTKRPIKSSEIARSPDNKLITSDWPWYGRDVNDAQTAWHNDRGKPIWPFLFGDGHVALFQFPKDFITSVGGGSFQSPYRSLKPDPHARYWW